MNDQHEERTILPEDLEMLAHELPVPPPAEELPASPPRGGEEPA